MMLRTLMEYHSPRAFFGSTRLYNNANDRQHYLVIYSEQKSQEISAKKTPANTSKQAQAHPVFSTIQLMASHKTDHFQDMISFARNLQQESNTNPHIPKPLHVATM